MGIWATGAVPAQSRFVPLLYAVVLTSNLAVTFLAMSVESLMVYGTRPEQQGRAAGWFQAGNLGGYGLGGGAGLWMAEHLSEPWIAGAVLGGRVRALLPCARVRSRAAGAAPNGQPSAAPRRSAEGSLARRALATGVSRTVDLLPSDRLRRSIQSVVRGRRRLARFGRHRRARHRCAQRTRLGRGLPCRRLFRRPHRSQDRIRALRPGDRSVRRGDGVGAANRAMYIAFTTAYAFIQGLCYAGFSAVVLEAIGLGAAATKYTLFASLSNMPIMYMTRDRRCGAHALGSRWHALYRGTDRLVGLAVFIAVTVATAAGAGLEAERRS